jgi:hypothetical protein
LVKGVSFAHIGGKLQQAHLVLRAQDGVGEAPRRVRLLRHILAHAAAGVDGQRQVQRQLRLALEDRDLLRPAVLGDAKVLARQAAHNGPIRSVTFTKTLTSFS